MIAQVVVNGMVIGLVYGIVALGFVVIYKSTAVLNLAQGELLMLGGFVGWITFESLGLPIPLAVVLTLGISYLVGMLLERVFIRRLIGEPLIAVIVLTLALSVLLRGVGMITWGELVHTYPVYDVLLGSTPVFGMALNNKYIMSLIVAAISLGLFSLYFRYTKSGVSMRAVADDQLAAQSVGISVRRVFNNAWGIAALTAGVGGIILGFLTGVTTFGTPLVGLKALPIVILGGLESLPGAIVGGIIIGIAEQASGFYLDPIVGAGMKDLIPYILMLIILVVKPYGLFGLTRIERI